MHITSYLIRRSPQFPTFMRHLRHSRDVSDVRPTFATFGFQHITVAQKSVPMFVHFCVIALWQVRAWEYYDTLETYFVALPCGLNLSYCTWEIVEIWWRYDNSTIVTHWDTFLSSYLNNPISTTLVLGVSSLGLN